MSAIRRMSIASDSSESSTPGGELYDDGDSLTYHANDSQSSLGVSLEEMELDSADFEYKCRMSPISRLPAELLIAVFAKLPSTADLRNCMLVSKVWARNSVDLLWHRPATHNWPNLHNIIQTTRKHDGYFKYHELVKRLNLAQLTDQVSDGTLHPLSGCKRIERLTLTGCSRLTDLSVAKLIDGNRSLLAIDISGLSSVTDKTLLAVANSCFRLQGLNIAKCSKLTDDSLVAVARNCRRVKRLKFNDCPQFTDYSILAFADNCHDILEIDLHGCVNMTDMAVTALIAQERQLRELRLAHCSRITDDAFLSLPENHYYESLRVLDLTDCSLLQDAGLQKIVFAAPRLRNLVLAKCRLISDKGVMAITRLGKNLHYIHLGHCNRITDYGVAHLVTFCNRIRYIDLACCVNLTDDSVSLLATLPKLKRIGLVKCHNITDKSLKALAKPKPAGNGSLTPSLLERLHLSYCSQLSISGVRTMLINCPQLTHLSLTGVHDFLREDLLEFCRPAPDEFNDHQRDVFCVFSGPGVKVLRKHLQDNYASEPSSEVESEGEETHSHPPHHHHHHHNAGPQIMHQHLHPHAHAHAAHHHAQGPHPRPPPIVLQGQFAHQPQSFLNNHILNHHATIFPHPNPHPLPPPPPLFMPNFAMMPQTHPHALAGLHPQPLPVPPANNGPPPPHPQVAAVGIAMGTAMTMAMLPPNSNDDGDGDGDEDLEEGDVSPGAD